MTPTHILPGGACGTVLPLVYASKITMGDCILTVSGQEIVTDVRKVHGEGLYTVVTNEVNILLM
jgi:hypothetical protein